MKADDHRGPSLDSFMKEEGFGRELKAIVEKERAEFQLAGAIKKQRISNAKLARPTDADRA